MSNKSNVESVERVIDAPPERIFPILADPHRHHEIDGSGTVREARMRVDRLALGSRFGMSMRMGLPYSMVNTVIEYEENRRIAWQTRAPGVFGRFIGGRIWRYELEPVADGTLVRETWDISQEARATHAATRKMAPKARRNMAATLERLAGVVTG